LSMRVIAGEWHIVFHPEMQVVHYRDPRGRDRREIARLISRNAYLTAIARFPLWMLPAALAVQAARIASKSWLRRPTDFCGPFVAAAGAARHLAAALRHRRTIAWASLRRYKGLARHPVPWTLPADFRCRNSKLAGAMPGEVKKAPHPSVLVK
jgi:hypothetical protein